MISFHVYSQHTDYRRFHSSETSILKLACNAFLAADLGNVTLIGLLDLSAAFDTIYHDILISRLQSTFGVHGTVLSWITSFSTKRTQTVNFAGQQSTLATVLCGVPQGSVLGPVLFLLYTADVSVIAQRHGFWHTLTLTIHGFTFAIKFH